MVSGGKSAAHVHGTSRLDGRQSPRRQVQEDDEEHPREPRRCARSRHGAAHRAGGAPRHHGADHCHAQPPRLDSPDSSRTRRFDSR